MFLDFKGVGYATLGNSVTVTLRLSGGSFNIYFISDLNLSLSFFRVIGTLTFHKCLNIYTNTNFLMIQKYKINFDLNQLLSNVKLKKKYLNSLKSKNVNLIKILDKGHKYLNYNFLDYSNDKLCANYFLVTHVISISFSRSNTFLHVTDFFGKLIFFYSAGSFKHSGKSKKARFIVFKDIYQKLVSKLSFLKNNPVALHLQDVDSNRSWIIKKLETRFFIRCVKIFNSYPHNGCRKRKVRKKKFKKRKRRSG